MSGGECAVTAVLNRPELVRRVVMYEQTVTERGVFEMSKPRGWTIERIVSLVAGTVVLITQIGQTVRPAHSGVLRIRPPSVTLATTKRSTVRIPPPAYAIPRLSACATVA